MRLKRILFILFLIAAVLVGALLTTAKLLGPEARAVPSKTPGYGTLTLDMGHRPDEPVNLFIWYPPADPSAPSQMMAQTDLFYGFHAQPDAAPKPGAHPVVLLSHGSGGNAPQLGWLATDLALKGAIVLGLNHPGTTSGDSDPHRTPHIWERPADLKAALDHLEKEQPIGLEPDLTRVASMGFSLGGHTALALAGAQVSKDAFIAYCDEFAGQIDCGWMQEAGVDFTAIEAAKYEASHREPRVMASVAIDPALPRAMTAESLVAMDLPILLLTLGTTAEIPAGMRTDQIATQMPNVTRHEVEGAWHITFLRECSRFGQMLIGLLSPENICADPGTRPRTDAHNELRRVIGDFLTEELDL